MKKILVPVDFSEISTHAAQFALDLATKHHAQVTFLHCIHFDYFDNIHYTGGFNFIDEISEVMNKRMDDFVVGLKTHVSVSKKIIYLNLLEAIRETVKDEKIDLVVMGTHGSSGWSEFLIGSNTEKVVRYVDCPVIAVPSHASLKTIKKILVPIDLREIQTNFMTELAQLQKDFSASLEFLWVKTPHNIENEELVTNEFRKLIDDYQLKNASFHIERTIFPMDGIISEAKDVRADMIAMATHARRGISHWLSGSLTEDTINHVDIPVWTFKLSNEAENIELMSVKHAKGVPEYKKLQPLV